MTSYNELPPSPRPPRVSDKRTSFLAAAILIVHIGAQLSLAGARGLVMSASHSIASHPPEYGLVTSNGIIGLQRFRQSSSVSIKWDNQVQGTATLTNLNPNVNIWFLLTVTWKNGTYSSYHLQNSAPHFRELLLDPEYTIGIEIIEGQVRTSCNLFGPSSPNALEQARKSALIYAPLCDGQVYLRNPTNGYRTTLEAATEFLRKDVWRGENVIVFVHHFLEDRHRETGEIHPQTRNATPPTDGDSGAVPLPARVDHKYADRVLKPTGLGIAVENDDPLGLRPGTWYRASGNRGIYVSILEPDLIEPTILDSYKKSVSPLDHIEASALCYLVGFDLSLFDVGYALGTNHPSVGWSDHIQPGIKDLKLPGPDGIGTISPLVSTGLVNPNDMRRTVATFTGGFKREHGAFRFGELAVVNYGSHYGFLEDGVLFSKLQPGLATIFVMDDGSLHMKTWDEHDEQNLATVKFARQNGVPLVEFDNRSRLTLPGNWVNNWGAGNWSGSEDRKLRTLRSAAALQVTSKTSFLIYAVFSDATPSAMARVFQAYQCSYGMLLDMNALEHTYLALYRGTQTQLFVDHLISGMSEVEKSDSSGFVPRFLGYPDNRDFFYIMRRSPKNEAWR